MDLHLDILLGLPNVSVESCSRIEGFVCLKLTLLNEGISCPHCEQYTEELHQTRLILIRDLPVFGQSVYLKVPRRQFYCPNCQRYPTERLAFMSLRRSYTERYERYIYERVKGSTLEQVSREECLSADEVRGVFERQSQFLTKKTGAALSGSAWTRLPSAKGNTTISPW